MVPLSSSPPFFTLPVKIGCGIAIVSTLALVILFPPVSMALFGVSVLSFTTTSIILPITYAGALMAVVGLLGFRLHQVHTLLLKKQDVERAPLLTDVDDSALKVEKLLKNIEHEKKALEVEVNSLRVKIESLTQIAEEFSLKAQALENKIPSPHDFPPPPPTPPMQGEEIKKLEEEVHDLIEFIQSQEKDLEKLKGEITQKQSTIDSLEEALRIKNNPPPSSELKEAYVELTALKATLRDKNEQLEKLKSSKEESFEFYEIQDKLKRAQLQIEDHEAEMSQKNRRIKSLEDKVCELELKLGAEPHKEPTPRRFTLPDRPPALPLRTQSLKVLPAVNHEENADIHSSKKRIVLETKADVFKTSEVIKKFAALEELDDKQLTQYFVFVRDRISQAGEKDKAANDKSYMRTKTAVREILLELHPFKELTGSLFEEPSLQRFVYQAFLILPDMHPRTGEVIFEYLSTYMTPLILKRIMRAYIEKNLMKESDSVPEKCISKYQDYIDSETDHESLFRLLTLVFGSSTLDKNTLNHLIERLYKEKKITRERLEKMGHEIAAIRKNYSGKNIEGQLEIARLIARLLNPEPATL